ncbi:MAG: hypothetical protein GXO77_10890 [Calditrichaeota bacterium]|nr:hypothetical protein [Calditrichota bacterium]
MKKVSLILLVLSISFLYSQPPIGSKSLLHTHSAQTMGKGFVTLYSNMNFFTRATQFVGSGQPPQNFSAANYWLVVGQTSLSWGILDHLDLIISPRIYQDTHYSNEYNLPGDIFASLKLGSYSFMERKFYTGVITTFRFPTGEKHNYPFVEYASGAVEYAFTGMLSYFMDPYLPDRSLSFHLNLGWWNHNEAGKTVYDYRGKEFKATKNSSQLQYSLGIVYPTSMFDYRLEIEGITFLNEPDDFVYSRENYMYVSPSIRYNALSWLSADLGVDIRVSSDKNTTNYTKVAELANPDYNLPNYCSWRVQMGLNIQILPITTRRLSSAELEREKFKKRVEFFQKIVEERDRTKDVQEELEKLKKEREQAERELEELKQILQEEK